MEVIERPTQLRARLRKRIFRVRAEGHDAGRFFFAVVYTAAKKNHTQ